MMGMVLPANLVTASVSERVGAPQTIALACVITAAGCVALLPIASGTNYPSDGSLFSCATKRALCDEADNVHYRRSAGTTKNGIMPSTTLTSANAISGL
jgi:hypothetical protein